MKTKSFVCRAVLCAAIAAGSSRAQSLERVSETWNGAEAGGDAGVISSNGRYVAFHSGFQLVPQDTNFFADVYVHDRATGQLARASVDSSGAQGDEGSSWAAISADGHLVAFASLATNLVPGDTNAEADIFVRDMVNGQTTRVSVGPAGAQADDSSEAAALSTDGRYVAFVSRASNLVTSDANGFDDVFVHDRQSGQTVRVSVDSAGAEASGGSGRPVLSADGRFVAFDSDASNLVAGDTNAWTDVFVHDRQTRQTTRVSVSSAGAQGNLYSLEPSISADGRLVAFFGEASNLVPNDTSIYADVFVHDRLTSQTTRVSVGPGGVQGNQNSFYPSEFSTDGRYLAFSAYASNLFPNDTNGFTDVLVVDLVTGQLTCVSRNSLDALGNQESGWPIGPSLSGDGLVVAFGSLAYNLVLPDSFVDGDVFVRDVGCAYPLVYCTAKVNSLGCAPSISITSTPSASANVGAIVRTVKALGNVNGVFFHHVGAPSPIPFHGGWLCVGAPVKRHGILNSGGMPGTCQGQYSESFNAYIASGADPALVAGVTVNVQCWSRDPLASFGDSSSDAITTTVCP